jgi:hypothetical protein
VGTRCWVALFTGRDNGDPLFLQVKEAEAAVGEPFLGASEYPHHGQRVVEGQRLMQGASDIFLGWDQFRGEDGVTRDFYLRQLWDWKFSADVDDMAPEALGIYAQMCGWTLARAHARSGDPSPWPPTWGRATASTGPCASSPRPTPTRTSGTSTPLTRAIAAGHHMTAARLGLRRRST